MTLKDETRIYAPVTSVLLPAYNEAETIVDTVTAYHKEICEKLPAELIVAEDGSTDGTKEILASLKNKIHFRLLSDHNRKGYAKAVSDALRDTNGEWVFFSDSDGQYFPSDFWNLWAQRDGYDMIIGCKTHRRESAHRLILAKGFHEIVNGLFHLNLRDADCGFRLLRKEVIRSVVDEVKFLEYSFWAEFTIRACLKSFRIREVPINHGSRACGDTHIYKLPKIPLIVLQQLRGLARLYSDERKGR